MSIDQQTGNFLAYALCSSATVRKTVGWAMQLLFSGKISLSGSLKVILSNKWSYKLVFLPVYSERSSSKAHNVLCGLDSSQPMPEVPWLNRATDFSLGVISCLLWIVASCSCVWGEQVHKQPLSPSWWHYAWDFPIINFPMETAYFAIPYWGSSQNWMNAELPSCTSVTRHTSSIPYPVCFHSATHQKTFPTDF